MYIFNMKNGFALMACLSLVFAGLIACSDDSSSKGSDEPDLPDVRVDTIYETDSAGNTIVRVDTLEPTLDTVRHIDPETGDTVYKVDTVYVPADTTLTWVGNSALVITEISPVNLDWLDENGDDPGWIEIYNAGDSSANLKGYSLVENLEKPRKWVFGDIPIAAKAFVVVFCDKNNVAVIEGNSGDASLHNRPHTNWKLNKDGGSVYLIDRSYGIRDSIHYPEIGSGMSWGIVDGGEWKFFDKPTPEQANTTSTAYDGLAPKFNFTGNQGGFYNDKFTLNPPTDLPEGMTVRCTQDGSLPTESSPEFNSPLLIDHTMVLRCAAYKQGLLTKDVVTNTYFIGETVKMPVVAVSLNPRFFDLYYKKTDGGEPDMDNDLMYAPNKAYPDSTGEYPAHVEYFENGSSSNGKAWETEAGMSLMGGWSRMERKKSVAIVMREEYGGKWLHYPLFETRKGVNDKYKGFNLRNNGNRFVSDYFADALGGAILEGSEVDYQRSRQVVVFYNGKYYGIHDMRERYNKNFVETNYGIDASSVTFLKHLGKEIEASNGSPDEYIAMLDFAATNDFSTNDEAYAHMASQMDMTNFARYMVAEMYIHNGDWPNNNVRVWKAPESPLWKFMIYDLDHGFDWEWGVNGFDEYTNMFKWVKQGGRTNGSCYTSDNKAFSKDGKGRCFHVLYAKLIENPKFRSLFLNQAAIMLQNYLNAKNVESVRSWMAASIDPAEAERDLEHNGQKKRGYSSFSVSNSGLTTWAEKRDTKFLSEIQSEFGVSNLVSVNISANGKGSILMDGASLPNGSYKGKLFAGNTVELMAVQDAGAVFGGWAGCEPVSGAPEKCIVTVAEGVSVTATFN